MRYKDEHKKEAIFEAAIKLINKIGFAETSISKIAGKAGVSPATIYIYFKNKEDLLSKMYLMVKQKLSQGFLKGVKDDMPIEERFRKLWKNMFYAFADNPAYFRFVEQFTNSPLINKVIMEEALSYYSPLYDLYDEGRKTGIFKEHPVQLISYFTFLPIKQMVKDHLNGDFTMSDNLLETAVELAWEAITK